MHRTTLKKVTRPLGVLASLAALAAGCGGAIQLEPRFVAVHNTMAAMGFVHSGEISQGSLSEGGEARVRTSMGPGDCYTVVALGADGVADLDVVVLGPDGSEVARDSTTDGQAAAQYCPSAPGIYEIAVRMHRGGGGYMVSSWSGGPRPGESGGYSEDPMVARPAHGGPGTCDEPHPLVAGTPMRGDTTTGDAVIGGSCLGGGMAPEIVYQFTIDQRSMVSAVITSDYDGALYLLGTCGESRSEIACNDDAPTTSRSEVAATLEPGLYFLVVDGFSSASGNYELMLSTTPMQTVAQVCGGAQPIVLGQPMSGTTAGQPDYFQATCAGQAQSPDRVYSLDVTQRSRLRVRMQSSYDGAVYVRSDCGSMSSELACNDDYIDTRHSLVTATVDPGRYYIFADGYSSGSSGDYSVLTELGPESGGGPGDTCATALPAVAGQELASDTFVAADDFAGTCGGAGSPDVVHRIDARSRTRIRASVVDQEFSSVMYLRLDCAVARSEVACVAAGPGAAGLDQTVGPGTYFLVVDGADAHSFGSSRVALQIDDLGAVDQACRTAPLIRPGRQITGDTTGQTDRFQASCAGQARSPDVIYRLVLRRAQRVRISSEQTDYDGAIYIRSDCTDAGTEVACNDDAGDNRHSFVEVVLQPGTYFVFVDGFSSGNQGHYTLDVDLTSP